MKAELFHTLYDKFTMNPDSIKQVSLEYPDIKLDTIEAIFRRHFQIETMKNVGKLQRTKSAEALLDTCLSQKSIKTVAQMHGLSVCALSRFMMRSMYSPDKVTEYLNCPHNIPHEQLSAILVAEIDPEGDLSHPSWDSRRRAHGERKEQELKEVLREQNILFFEESDLRKFGYPKTPDFKLAFPIGLNQNPICWIESKALFGDEIAHSEYTKSQYQPYVSRFGPGAVIYWHGYIDELAGQLDGIHIFDGESFVSALSHAIKIAPL